MMIFLANFLDRTVKFQKNLENSSFSEARDFSVSSAGSHIAITITFYSDVIRGPSWLLAPGPTKALGGPGDLSLSTFLTILFSRSITRMQWLLVSATYNCFPSSLISSPPGSLNCDSDKWPSWNPAFPIPANVSHVFFAGLTILI